MERVEDRLVGLLERKADEVTLIPPLSAETARRSSRRRFLRKRGAPAVTMAGIIAVAALAAGIERRSADAPSHAAAAIPTPQLGGASGGNEWRLTAIADGPEHCLIVRISYHGRPVDTSHGCGVHVGDVEPDAGPGVTAVNAGNEMLAMMGQVGPAVATVALETESGRETIESMPIPWDTPPDTRFYIFFVDRVMTEGNLSTYDAAGRLIRETRIEFAGGDAFIRDQPPAPGA